MRMLLAFHPQSFLQGNRSLDRGCTLVFTLHKKASILIVMEIYSTLRKVKHQCFLLKKSTKNKFDNFKDNFLIRSDRFRDYHYQQEKYTKIIGGQILPNSYTFSINHLLFNSKKYSAFPNPVPMRLFCVWAGENVITPNRIKSLDILKKVNKEIEVILIDNSNLDQWIVPDHPLPKIYEHLSYNHRSDYLRSYLMHHHGGAYSDIKEINAPWAPLLKKLNSREDVWVIGPQEVSSFNCSPAKGRLGNDQKRYFTKLICPAAMACKPKSQFTSEWLGEVERRLRYYEDLLQENPAEQPWGSNTNYPIAWNALGGQIFSPLCLKFKDQIIVDTKTVFTSELRKSVAIGNHR